MTISGQNEVQDPTNETCRTTLDTRTGMKEQGRANGER
jgi:hypothetical protein